MAIDLGLNQSPSQAKKQKIELDVSHHTSDDDNFYGIEARRAYIGCYYLSILYDFLILLSRFRHIEKA